MIQLADATILANNEAVAVIPNSVKYTEGLGEQTVRAASVGGGKAEQIFAQNIETSISKLIFLLPTTPESITLARAWKTNGNQNVFQIAGSTAEGDVTRTFTQASVVNDYEVEIGSETSIEIEVKSNPAI